MRIEQKSLSANNEPYCIVEPTSYSLIPSWQEIILEIKPFRKDEHDIEVRISFKELEILAKIYETIVALKDGRFAGTLVE